MGPFDHRCVTLARGTARHDVTPVWTKASPECHERAGCLDDFKQDVDAAYGIFREPAGTDFVFLVLVLPYHLAIGSIIIPGVLFAFSRAPSPETAKTRRSRASR